MVQTITLEISNVEIVQLNCKFNFLYPKNPYHSMEICNCKQGYGSPYGIGICMQCGKESCHNYFGCFVSDPEHKCKNEKVSRR